MAKTLFIIRHAQAEDNSGDGHDMERELTATGQINAARTGRYFFKGKISPDLILSSPAKRALETASLIAEQLKIDTSEIEVNEEIYDASVRNLLQLVNMFEETWQTIFLIAHNPAASYLAEYLTGEQVGTLAAGGMAIIEFEGTTWHEVTQGSGKLQASLAPHDFDDEE